ncbi:hypothetical protein [Pseudonocardia xishanensis]|uniref:hypothetical protein n=1 Tax=Pseudonocardia xishanensis TaxID=630995 RepID=UPI0031E563DD
MSLRAQPGVLRVLNARPQLGQRLSRPVHVGVGLALIGAQHGQALLAGLRSGVGEQLPVLVVVAGALGGVGEPLRLAGRAHRQRLDRLDALGGAVVELGDRPCAPRGPRRRVGAR